MKICAVNVVTPIRETKEPLPEAPRRLESLVQTREGEERKASSTESSWS